MIYVIIPGKLTDSKNGVEIKISNPKVRTGVLANG